MYPNLKLQIFKRGIHQNNLARELGINEAILSKIIRGYRQPSETQRQKLAQYLEADESWLFERFDRDLAAPLPDSASPRAAKHGES